MPEINLFPMATQPDAAAAVASPAILDEYKRKLLAAQLLTKNAAENTPVYGPWGAMSKLAGGAIGGYLEKKATDDEKSAQEVSNKRLAELLMGGNSATNQPQGAPTPTPPPAFTPDDPSTPAARPFQVDTGDEGTADPGEQFGKALTTSGAPLKSSERDDDLAIRTIAAEASSNPDEMLGVAAVIKNRVSTGRWGDTPASVVLAKNQFEPWNPNSGNDPRNIDPGSPKYLAAKAAWEAIKNGEAPDPTNGATHFYAPAAQAALGRAAPKWAQGQEGQQLGKTVFYAPEGRVTSAQAAPAPQQAAPANAAQAIAAATNDQQPAPDAVPATAYAPTPKPAAAPASSSAAPAQPKRFSGSFQEYEKFMQAQQAGLPAVWDGPPPTGTPAYQQPAAPASAPAPATAAQPAPAPQPAPQPAADAGFNPLSPVPLAAQATAAPAPAPAPAPQQTAQVDPRALGQALQKPQGQPAAPQGGMPLDPGAQANPNPVAPQQLAQALQQPSAAQGQQPGLNRALAAQILADPRVAPQMKTMIMQQMQPTYGFQTLPDGTIIRTDPRNGTVTPVYTAATKPTFADIGTDPTTGQPVKGFVDPNKREVQPYQLPSAQGQQPPGYTLPPGADPKKAREMYTESSMGNQLPAKSSETAEVRKEVMSLPSYKNYQQALPVYRSMSETAGRDNKASDLNLIYGLGKIMDPNSVVREGELVMANDTQGLGDRLNGMIKSIQGGARLQPEVRQQILQEAFGRMKVYEDTYSSDADHYRGVAQRNRMNPEDVVPAIKPVQPWKPEKADEPKPDKGPVAPPKVNDVQDGYRFKGGNPADPNAWEKVR